MPVEIRQHTLDYRQPDQKGTESSCRVRENSSGSSGSFEGDWVMPIPEINQEKNVTC